MGRLACNFRFVKHNAPDFAIIVCKFHQSITNFQLSRITFKIKCTGRSLAFRGKYCVTSPRKQLRTVGAGEGWCGEGTLASPESCLREHFSPPARATQASPRHCAPLPPLRRRVFSSPQIAYPCKQSACPCPGKDHPNQPNSTDSSVSHCDPPRGY